MLQQSHWGRCLALTWQQVLQTTLPSLMDPDSLLLCTVNFAKCCSHQLAQLSPLRNTPQWLQGRGLDGWESLNESEQIQFHSSGRSSKYESHGQLCSMLMTLHSRSNPWLCTGSFQHFSMNILALLIIYTCEALFIYSKGRDREKDLPLVDSFLKSPQHQGRD